MDFKLGTQKFPEEGFSLPLCGSAYNQGILKIYEDIYSHCHPARVDDFIARLERVKQESPDRVGIGIILSLEPEHCGIDETAIKANLELPQHYDWTHTLVDFDNRDVKDCRKDLEGVLRYINGFSLSPVIDLSFPYNPSMGTMGKLKHKLLIHCGAGMGRTGTVLIGVICLREGVLFEECSHKLKGYSHSLRPDTSIQRQAIKEMFSSH